MVSVCQQSVERATRALGAVLLASAVGAGVAAWLSAGDGLVLAPDQWGTIAQRLEAVAWLVLVAFAMAVSMSGLAHLRGRHETIVVDARIWAAAILILWYAAFNLLLPTKFGDENANQNAISGIVNGDWSFTQVLAVIPGYHWAVAQASKAWGPSLLYTRTLTCLLSVAMLWVYYDLAQRDKPAQSDHAVIALALLPIIFPYSAAAYTDVPSVALVLAGLLALSRRHFVWSALMVLLSCYLRQSNLVWMGLFPVIAAWQLWQEMRADPIKDRLSARDFLVHIIIARLYPFFVAAAFFIASFFLVSQSLIWGHVPANRPRPNLGNLFAITFYALLLWAPIWLPRAGADLSWLGRWAVRHVAPALVAVVGALGVGAALFFGYDNFHPWNQSFGFLTNIPLVFMQELAWVRVLGIVAVWWAVLAFGRIWWEQSHRVELLLVLGFFIIFMLPHALVDPRYYMVPFALINLFWVYPAERTRALLFWWAALSVFIGGAMILGHWRYLTISW